MRTGRRGVAGDLGREAGALELERLEFRIHRLVELDGALTAALGQVGGGLFVTLRSRARLGIERREPLGPGIDEREVGGMARGKRGELVDRHIVFARGRAQRKQPLLDALELARIAVGNAQGLFEVCARLLQRGEGGIERLDRRPDQGLRLFGPAFEPAQGRGEHRHRLAAGKRLMRGAQILGDFFRLHHRRAPIGKRGLLARLRRKARQLLDRMPQPVGLALCAFDLGAVACDRVFGRALRAPGLRYIRRLAFKPAIGVEQQAMGGRINQRAGVVLAVDLDERRAEALQGLHAHRLIVDEGAGAAVGELRAPQDQLTVRGDVMRRQQRPCRVLAGQLERRRHLTLLRALAHQARIAARAEREREGIEQDRLAGAGLAGQHREPGVEVDIEPIDQHDVADREAGQHGRSNDPNLSPSGQTVSAAAGELQFGGRDQTLL